MKNYCHHFKTIRIDNFKKKVNLKNVFIYNRINVIDVIHQNHLPGSVYIVNVQMFYVRQKHLLICYSISNVHPYNKLINLIAFI